MGNPAVSWEMTRGLVTQVHSRYPDSSGVTCNGTMLDWKHQLSDSNRITTQITETTRNRFFLWVKLLARNLEGWIRLWWGQTVGHLAFLH